MHLSKHKSKRREFINTPVIVEKYLLTPQECADALGVRKTSLARFRRVWKSNNDTYGPGPQPIYFGPGIIRYRIDDIIIPSDTQPDFLSRMKMRLEADIAAEQKRAGTAAKGSK